MKTVFKSKIGIGVFAPPFIILSVVSYLLIQTGSGAWIAILIPVLVLFFILHMIFTTDYTLDNNLLIVRCGFFYHKTFKVDEITKIIATKNPVNAPATSLDRLRIEFANRQSVLVSPRKQKEFIASLCRKNLNIMVKVKKYEEKNIELI
ncbi:MAG TPA: PH domain-containing protein [Edaphocola sp.]|nr:PH domain-containing protein [Edaphocola sp.]